MRRTVVRRSWKREEDAAQREIDRFWTDTNWRWPDISPHSMIKPTDHEHTRIILDSIADGVFTVDVARRITSFNRAAEKITGVRRQEAIGRYCWEVFRASICEESCSLLQTMQTGRVNLNPSIYIVNARGDRIPISISTALLKDGNGEVTGAVETFRDLSVVEALRKELEGRHTFKDIISKSPKMLRLFGMLELISETDSTILLEGESGTGKELFAKAIHSLSRRRGGPMVTVNCASLPDTLLESELFGYRAGAFTDAKKDKPGRVALAEKGTLFLDEIGDISPMLQVRLLRVLQEKVYQPLGSNRPVMADLRIVAATNRNLETLVAQERFRRDLFYRINVVRLYLPPLRERKEDIPLLVNHFISKTKNLYGRRSQSLTPEAMARLMSHDYPGNVRELENIIEYASVVCRDQWIGLEHLPDSLHPGRRPARGGDPSRGGNGPAATLDDVEKEFIVEVLRRNAWNRKVTARQLDIHPSTLWRKIKRHGITLPAHDGRKKSL